MNWTNIETERANEEIFDGTAWLDEFDNGISIADAASILKELAQEEDTDINLALVDWQQIATSMYDYYMECEES
jgi:hypothetical protein